MLCVPCHQSSVFNCSALYCDVAADGGPFSSISWGCSPLEHYSCLQATMDTRGLIGNRSHILTLLITSTHEITNTNTSSCRLLHMHMHIHTLTLNYPTPPKQSFTRRHLHTLAFCLSDINASSHRSTSGCKKEVGLLFLMKSMGNKRGRQMSNESGAMALMVSERMWIFHLYWYSFSSKE